MKQRARLQTDLGERSQLKTTRAGITVTCRKLDHMFVLEKMKYRIIMTFVTVIFSSKSTMTRRPVNDS